MAAKLIGISAYDDVNHDLILISFEYTQRAPDDLIEKLGILLEANINSQKRKSERITLTAENVRKISLDQKETVVFLNNVPRRCILKDISFSGAKLFLVGVANFVLNKDIIIRLTFDDPHAVLAIKGRSIRAEHVEGRKDLVAIAMDYYPETIPMIYKMYLNRYFSLMRTSSQEEQEEPEEAHTENQ